MFWGAVANMARIKVRRHIRRVTTVKCVVAKYVQSPAIRGTSISAFSKHTHVDCICRGPALVLASGSELR